MGTATKSSSSPHALQAFSKATPDPDRSFSLVIVAVVTGADGVAVISAISVAISGIGGMVVQKRSRPSRNSRGSPDRDDE